ncbi:uncharacterized protein N7459_005010 [Penicillium hispanicum]|uniref:uncharacterized protein n=1 Tax=Penicillium hispanicum TaxID=1080232 RepID=UPI0025415F99|nr:uncharacterized protein N7459_005010 [Penicillium hispanicum]KAJ5585210.1 hypothetical protein N7459_005010 [Penicillium hispanicum]
MALFSKRLTCFYCGRRPTQPTRGPVRKFHCDHCEADNYLDQNGEITDPPTADTNPLVYGPGASSPPFESVEFRETDLFCSQCLRNQHLFTSSLASYLPATDDPTSAQHDRDYDRYRKDLENRYPQVCDSCEPRVRQRIRQAGYEAKADHLRRMMDQSRASKTARQARHRSWQSMLVYIGALGYWGSVFGQLAWDAVSAIPVDPPLNDPSMRLEIPISRTICASYTAQTRRLPGDCVLDLAPSAGLALLAGSLSLWWNPKIRTKIEGRGGRFTGLGEYYQVQLIALVVRCVFWALLKDPSASGLEPNLPPALHMFMIAFTVLSVFISRRVVKYDARPLVNWSDNSWETAPIRSTETSPVIASRNQRGIMNTNAAEKSQIRQRFPFEKLATSPRSAERPSAVPPTPPPETNDDMDWTPSAPQDIRPTVSVYQRNQPSVLDGPLPFYGNIPSAPKPPAWKLRTQTPAKLIDQVVEPNPFQQTPTRQPNPWPQKSAEPRQMFKEPTFFPATDHDTSTGLEAWFDQAFTIDTNDEPKRDRTQPQSSSRPYSGNARSHLPFQYLRLSLLLGAIAAWYFSENRLMPIRGNYIEAGALGSASLIAGFSLLEAVKKPLPHWNGMEILIYITELAAAVHLGAHLSQEPYAREYFDRYGKLLLIFMAVQELLGLGAPNLGMSTIPLSEDPGPSGSASPHLGSSQQSSPHRGAITWSPSETTRSNSQNAPSFISQQSAPPPLSFTSSAGNPSFSSNFSPAPRYQLPSSQTFSSFPPAYKQNPHSFTMQSLKESEPPSDYEQDSDGETVATTATTMTDATTRNIRYGRNPNQTYNTSFSPRRNDLGPGIGGLSLEDRPSSRRITRSQTQGGLMGRRFPASSAR